MDALRAFYNFKKQAAKVYEAMFFKAKNIVKKILRYSSINSTRRR